MHIIAILIIGVCMLVEGPDLEVLSTAYQNMVHKESGKHPRRKEEKSNSIGGRKNSNAGIYQLISGPLVRVNNAARRGLLGIRRHIMQSIKKVK